VNEEELTESPEGGQPTIESNDASPEHAEAARQQLHRAIGSVAVMTTVVVS